MKNLPNKNTHTNPEFILCWPPPPGVWLIQLVSLHWEKKPGLPSPSSYQLHTASYLGVRGSFMPTFPSPEHVFLKSRNQHVYLCMPICETIADKTMNITLALKAMGV